MSLYAREELLEHMKRPFNKGVLSPCDTSSVAKNPFCGDIVKISLNVEEGKISDCKFDGESCGICTAAASLLTEKVIGGSLEDALRVSKEEIVEMTGATLTTSRIKCATLPLEALKDAIEKYKSSN